MCSTMPRRMFAESCLEQVSCEDGCLVYRMRDESGEGLMTCHTVYPGIYVVYNDLRISRYVSRVRPRWNVLEINHCRAGRMECEFEDGSFMYMEEGDLSIASKDVFCTAATLPLGRYHGISVIIDLSQAADAVYAGPFGMSVGTGEVTRLLRDRNKYRILRANDGIAQVFSGLYTVPGCIKADYMKLKVMELLLFLRTVDLSRDGEERPYCLKSQVDVIKDMMLFMARNLDVHYTLPELSERFGIPLTAMKSCFRCVYGTPIYSFMRSLRMNSAASMLRETDLSVMEIACRVGYSNAGKFAAAFRDIIGVTPTEYRKSAV